MLIHASFYLIRDRGILVVSDSIEKSVLSLLQLETVAFSKINRKASKRQNEYSSESMTINGIQDAVKNLLLERFKIFGFKDSLSLSSGDVEKILLHLL